MLGGFEIRVDGQPVLAALAQSRKGDGAGAVPGAAAGGAGLPRHADQRPVGRRAQHQPRHGAAGHPAPVPHDDSPGAPDGAGGLHPHQPGLLPVEPRSAL